MEGLGTLEDEYAGDDIYCQKVQDLAGKYKSMRRTRPDGNCFYRAFGYAYLEQLLDNQEEYNRYLTIYWPIVDKRGNTIPLNICHFRPRGKTLSHNGYFNWTVLWPQQKHGIKKVICYRLEHAANHIVFLRSLNHTSNITIITEF